MIDSLTTPKHNIIYMLESTTCMEALDMLEDYDLRCAPVLDTTGQLYRGNIYRYHIYKYHYHHPEANLAQLPVTHFLKNTTRFIRENASIQQLLFAMSDLPYIAVLDTQNTFRGLIYHDKMLHFYSQAWTRDTAGYILEVETLGARGELAKISRIINKYSDISAVTTFEATRFDTKSNITYLLPKEIDSAHVVQLIKELQKKDYKVTYYSLIKNFRYD